MIPIHQLKGILERIYGMLDQVDSGLSSIIGPDESPLRDLFKYDLRNYLLYLSASDGKITMSECDFINQLLDSSFDVNEYARYISDYNIYSEEFENKYPGTFAALTLFEAYGEILSGTPTEGRVRSYEPVRTCYEKVGLELINCDGNVTQQELDNLKIYLNNLDKSINENFSALLNELSRNTVSQDSYAVVGEKKKADKKDDYGDNDEYFFYYAITEWGRPLRYIEIYDRSINNIIVSSDGSDEKETTFTVEVSVLETLRWIVNHQTQILEWEEADFSPNVSDDIYNNDFLFICNGHKKHIIGYDLVYFSDRSAKSSAGHIPYRSWALIDFLNEIKKVLITQGIDPMFFELTI